MYADIKSTYACKFVITYSHRQFDDISDLKTLISFKEKTSAFNFKFRITSMNTIFIVFEKHKILNKLRKLSFLRIYLPPTLRYLGSENVNKKI